MEYYLLQNYKDKLTQQFMDGKIDVNVYFEMDKYLEKRQQFFTVNLN
jgi:hypothetical protein